MDALSPLRALERVGPVRPFSAAWMQGSEGTMSKHKLYNLGLAIRGVALRPCFLIGGHRSEPAMKKQEKQILNPKPCVCFENLKGPGLGFRL